MKARNPYYDFLRGIAILMVVGIHTYPASSFDSAAGTIQIVVRQVLNCAVPVFLAISGFLLGPKILDTKERLFSFWRRQIPKVYLPCLIWSLPLFMEAVDHGESLPSALLTLFSCGYGVYYFIALIIQCYLLLPALQQHNNRTGLTVAALISALSVALITWRRAIEGADIPLFNYAAPVTTWIVFFMLGLYLSSHNRAYALRWPLVAVAAGFILECLETHFLMGFHLSGAGIKPSSFIFSFAVIVLLFSQRLEQRYAERNAVLRTIRYCGEISFGVYLAHCQVIELVSQFVPESAWGLSWLATATITVCGAACCKWLFPSLSEKVLGIR